MSKAKGNPILEELWAIKDAYAKKFNYDLEAMFEDQKQLAEKLRQEGYKVSSLSEKKHLTDSPGRGH